MVYALRLKVFITVFLICTLTGCNSNNTNNTVEIENIAKNPEIEKAENTFKPNVTAEYGYDSINKSEYKPYDSGVYIDDKILAQPYSYTGTVYKPTEIASTSSDISKNTSNENNTKEIDYKAIDDRIEQINLEISENQLLIYSYTDSNGSLNIMPAYWETKEEAEEKAIKLINDAKDNIDKLEKEKYDLENGIKVLYIDENSEINDTTDDNYTEVDIEHIKSRIKKYVEVILYQNNIMQLIGYDDIDEYNKDHIKSMSMTINDLKLALESIEAYDMLINSTFKESTEVINSWNKVKDNLSKWRTILLNINTAEDYVKRNIEINESEFNDMIIFINAID